MQILRSLESLRTLPCPVHWAMGFFDGVHLGHQRVIASADTPGALKGVLTFWPHPLAVVRPGSEPKLITPLPQAKADLLAACGVDVLLVLPFNRELAGKSPQDFIAELCSACRVAGITVGSNWHFGKGGSGDAAFLQQVAKQHGFRACINEMLVLDGATVCSSRIRELLSEGEIEKANAMLGAPFSVRGVVEHGQKLARTLGFPTANIALPSSAALPAAGVYRVQCRYRGSLLKGIANVGTRPTIDESVKVTRLEAHFFDVDADLYGKELQVELIQYLREERKFHDVDSLRIQIQKDMQIARRAWS